MSGLLLDVQDLRVRFGAGPEVVRGVALALRRGQCLALIGESGSGKSVTARSLVGLAGPGARVSAARLQFDGQDLRSLQPRQWRDLRGGRIGFVMQDALGGLDPLRLVGAEIDEALRLHTGLNAQERVARVIDLLTAAGVPDAPLRAQQYPHQLSGGLRQRALIASALACAPPLLLADEPTTALDAVVQARILDLLAGLRGKDTAMLLVSHDFGVVARLADHVAVMLHGEIVESGPLQSVMEDPQHAYTKSLLHAAASVRGATRVARPVIAAAGPAAVALEGVQLHKHYTGPDGVARAAVADATLMLRSGETLGIVGESGSGKTTLTRLLLGLETPDTGAVRLRGLDWQALDASGRRRERRRIQVVFQDPLASFDPRHTVARVLDEALCAAGCPRGAARHARAAALLQMVRLEPALLPRRPLELSGGQRQRIAIARALAAEPDVLVCDEPVSALDVSVQAQVLDLLAELKSRLGLSCLFISHDLGVIRRISDRVLVMHRGAIVETGSVEDIFERPQHSYTRSLLAALPVLAPATREDSMIKSTTTESREHVLHRIQAA